MSSRLQGVGVNFSGVTSASRAYNAGFGLTSGSMLVAFLRLVNSNTASVTTVTDDSGAGNTWEFVVRKAGATAVTATEIWVCRNNLATAVGVLVTASFSSSVNGVLTVGEYNVSGSGSIQFVSDTNEEASTTTSHYGGATGLDAQADDVMVSVIAVELADSGTTPGTNWTEIETLSTRGATQDQLPTGTVTADRGLITTGAVRVSTGAMARFRRVAAGASAKPMFRQPTRFMGRRSF